MADISLTLPEYVKKAIDILERAGFEAWCVGGCVRDAVLGVAPSDWDLTTNALPEETKECFESFTTFDAGMKHGTVSVVIDRNVIEITTYRTDGAYADHRHPDNVEFSRNIRDDLSRRDFTVNAMAYHPERGLLDEFGGLDDIKNKLIRCVGDSEKRFDEDALRILRCLRFASVLGFEIDHETAKAAENKKELLSNISAERIREETTKLLKGKNAHEILRDFSDIIFTVLPELSPMKGCKQENPYHIYDVWEHTLHALKASETDGILRWAVLLHDCGKPSAKFYGEDGVAHFYGHEGKSEAIARNIMGRLKFSNRDTEDISALIKSHDLIHPLSEKKVKKLLAALGEENLFRLYSLSRADLAGQARRLWAERTENINATEALTREIIARGDCLTLKDLAVNGEDLIALGYEKGPSLGKALKALLESVLDSRTENDRNALLSLAAKMLEK